MILRASDYIENGEYTKSSNENIMKFRDYLNDTYEDDQYCSIFHWTDENNNDWFNVFESDIDLNDISYEMIVHSQFYDYASAETLKKHIALHNQPELENDLYIKQTLIFDIKDHISKDEYETYSNVFFDGIRDLYMSGFAFEKKSVLFPGGVSSTFEDQSILSFTARFRILYIVFEQGNQKEELTLNAGLTFICAYNLFLS